MNSIQVQPSPTGAKLGDTFGAINNMGVILLFDRKYHEAASCFNEALNFESSRLVTGPVASASNNALGTTTINTGPSTVRTFYLLFDDKGGNSSSKPHILNDGTSPLQGKGGETYVFHHPLVVSQSIPTTTDTCTPVVEACFSNLSSISFYNLALTFHLAALDTQYVVLGAAATATGIATMGTADPEEHPRLFQRELLRQALFYYEVAYRILVSDQDVLVYQAMVILNNLGQVHRLLDDEVTATKCFQHLLTTMVYLQQAGEAERIHHWDSFFSNVLGLISSQPGPAPAA